MGKPKPTFRDATEARHAYRRAEGVDLAAALGDWRLEVVGSPGYRDLHGKALRLLGIQGLWGLRIEPGELWHLVGRPKRLEQVRPLDLAPGRSGVDDRPALVAVAPGGAGRLWSRVRVEVRRLDADRLVGVDLVGPVRLTVPLPFVLHRPEA